jgi:putative Ca2+/H+ antiporter (TMEM165/GDT1 family)
VNWQTLFSTFGLVFVAELGDKTQLAVVTQICKYRVSLPVFLGGSFALSGVTALGVVGGQALGAVIPQDLIRAIAVLAFIVMGVLIWREAAGQGEDAEEADDACELACPDPEGEQPRVWNWKAFGSTMTLLFLAELGDKTQLAVVGLASKHASPWLVFAGGAVALTCVTALGVLGGRQLCRWIPERLLLRISGVAFVVMGIVMSLT